ncbi:uncharacterized protein LOC144002399 isoform X2 [Festucalex cinctus]
MFRRSRFSVRPNVGGAGRTAAPSQEAVPASQEAKEAPKDVDEIVPASAVTDSQPVDVPAAKATPVSDGNDPSGDGTGSSAAVQRRKRFSVKPRVAPGRLTAPPRTQKSPTKVAFENPSKNSDLDSQIETHEVLPGAQSPKSPETEPIIVSGDGSARADAVSADHSQNGTKKTEKSSLPSDDILIKVPPRPPEKEAAALSEKAKTLLSSKSRKSSIPRFSLSRLLNDPSDVQRLEKAQKLRDLLRQEMRKEKGAKRARRKREQECSLDPAKMTMRDLIRYLPTSDPTSLEDETQENETVAPVSPRREKSPERVQKLEPEVVPKTGSQTEEEQEEAAAAEEDEEDDGALMVPRVKVAEDGTLILDEESLTVEVQRAKGPNPAEGRDPIFERGSTTTYSSFRASTYCKPWTNEETDMFFLAISMVGTDFSMIGQLFHNRTRTEIRNKFKKEERRNSWRIDKAFRERRKLDIEYFTKLLEKILEVQANRKKLKSLVEKNMYKKRQRSSKGAKSKEFVDDLDSEEEEMDGFSSSEAEDGEKENDELRKDGKALVAKARQKRKLQDHVSAAKLKKTKSEAGEKSGGEDDACTPEDSEAALPEDQPDSQVCESAEMCKPSERTSVAPAKPVLPLGRKWSKKLPPAPTAMQAKDVITVEDDDGVADEASTEQIDKETIPPEEVSEAEEENSDGGNDDDVSSGDEDYSVKPAKPTRSGRVPKPPSHFNYPAEEEGPTSKPQRKSTSKRARSAAAPSSAPASKKSKLITLRASQSESSEDEEEHVQPVDEEEAFVPACLRSPLAVIQTVDETMEEDVIDLMSSEHAEASEAESFNEAAQTLLAIGNVPHFSQSETTETELESVNETDKLLEEGIAEFLKDNSSSQIPFADHGVTQMIETSSLVPTNTESSPRRTVSGPDTSPQTRRDNSSKVKPKPKPNLARASRTSHSKSQPDASPVESPMESCSLAHVLSEETTPMEEHYDQASENQTCDFTEANFEPAAIEAKPTDAEREESADQDSASQEIPKCQKRTEVKETRSRFPKVKPKPNLSQISRSARSKPKASEETSPSPNLESASKTTAEVEPQPASLETPGQSSSSASTVTPLMNSSASMMQSEELTSSEETMVSVGHAAGDAKSTGENADESLRNTEAASEPKAEDSKTLSVQESGELDTAVQEQFESQKPREVQPTRRSRFLRIKPNISHISRNAQSKPKTAEGSCQSEVETQPTCPLSSGTTAQSTSTTSNVTPVSNVSSGITHLEELASGEANTADNGLAAGEPKSIEAETVKSGRNNETAEVSELEAEQSKATLNREPADYDKDVLEGQKTSEVVSAHQTRTRFPKVKPKPNLQTSRNAQDKLKVGPSPNLESARETTAVVQPQPTDQITSSALVQPEIVNSSVIPSEELTRERKVPGTGLDASATETVESGRNNQTAEVEAEQSKATLNREPADYDKDVLEGQKTSEVVSAHQSRRSRFPKVKLKPNLLQTSRNAQDKPKVGPSPNLESARETTADVQPQPTDQITSSAPMETEIANEDSSVIPSEELTPEQKITGTGCDASATETVESGRNNEAVSDATVTKPQAENLIKPLDQKDGDPDSTSQELPECQNPSKVLSRRSRFPKVKPNLPQTSSRSSRSKSETTKETSTISDLESTCKETVEVESQPTCSFVMQKPSQSVRNPSTDMPVANFSSTLAPLREITSSEETAVGLGPDAHKEDPEASEHTQEAIQRRRRLPKLKPNLRSAARAAQSQDGLDKPADGASDCKSVSASSPSPSSEGGGSESTLSVTDGRSSETPAMDSGTGGANQVPAEAQTAKCTDDTSSPKTSAMRRGRLVKPKPNVGRGARQSRQETLNAGSDDVIGAQGETPVLVTPVEGADEQATSATETRAPEHHMQDVSASSAGANQTPASLPLFADTLSAPSDPDEPFFILSLTEVPLDESPHHPPQADLVQHSLPVDSAVAGTSGSPPAVPRGEIGVATCADAEFPVRPAPPAGGEDASAVTSSSQRRARGKAASHRPQVSKRPTRNRPTAASTAAPQLDTAQSTAEPLTACTIASQPPTPSLSSIEVSACHHSDGAAVQEEPTNVSQYFLSDIFTEVNDT